MYPAPHPLTAGIGSFRTLRPNKAGTEDGWIFLSCLGWIWFWVVWYLLRCISWSVGHLMPVRNCVIYIPFCPVYGPHCSCDGMHTSSCSTNKARSSGSFWSQDECKQKKKCRLPRRDVKFCFFIHILLFSWALVVDPHVPLYLQPIQILLFLKWPCFQDLVIKYINCLHKRLWGFDGKTCGVISNQVRLSMVVCVYMPGCSEQE